MRLLNNALAVTYPERAQWQPDSVKGKKPQPLTPEQRFNGAMIEVVTYFHTPPEERPPNAERRLGHALGIIHDTHPDIAYRMLPGLQQQLQEERMAKMYPRTGGREGAGNLGGGSQGDTSTRNPTLFKEIKD